MTAVNSPLCHLFLGLDTDDVLTHHTVSSVLMRQFDLHLFIGRGECLEDEFDHVFSIAPNLLWCSLVERHVTTRRENQD